MVNSKLPELISKVDEKQRNLLETEMLILVDPEDRVVGTDTKLNCHIWDDAKGESPLHRAYSVYMWNTKKEFILTQRAKTKVVSPLRYTNTCCSHPLATPEESEEKDALGIKRAACRRLCEELGIPKGSVTPQDLICVNRFHYKCKSTEVPGFGEHELYYLFICVKDVEMNPDPNEVAKVQYLKRSELPEFQQKLRSKEIWATPWFKHAALNTLDKYWDNLDNLGKIQDMTIHHLDLPDL